MKDSGFKCDVCDQPKQEANHWWGAQFKATTRTIIYRPWNEWGAVEEMTHHLCGQGCCLALHERYLDGRLEKEAS